MTLENASSGVKYVVEKITCENFYKARLWQLGFEEGAAFTFLRRYFSGGVIVSVEGAKIALGRDLCREITIRAC